MYIGKKSEYAILGIFLLSCRPANEFIKIEEVVKNSTLPRALMLKIFNRLKNEGILESKSGIRGGFRLKKKTSQLSLFDIIKIFESSPYVCDCAAKKNCNVLPSCCLGGMWHEAQERINEIMKDITFDKLMRRKTTNFIPLCNCDTNE